MHLVLVSPPLIEPLSYNDIASHLRVTDGTNGSTINSLAKVAIQALDGRDGLLGRALIQQTWKMSLDRFPRSTIELPLPPLISVDEITYLDSDGIVQLIALENVIASGVGDSEPATIEPVSGTSWPSTYNHPEAIQITFTAGYVSVQGNENGAKVASGLIPEPLRQAMLLHISHLFENREAVTVASGFMAVTPHGYDDLIAPYRLRAF